MNRSTLALSTLVFSIASLLGAAGCSGGEDFASATSAYTHEGNAFGSQAPRHVEGQPAPAACIDNVYCISGTHFDRSECRCVEDSNHHPVPMPPVPVDEYPHGHHTAPPPKVGGGSLF